VTPATDLALAFAEAAGQVGGWTVPSPYTLVVNWDGSTGTRPVAIAAAPQTVQKGTSLPGPVITNAVSQNPTGGSFLLIAGTSVAVHGTGTPLYVHGVTGGSSATIPTPSGMQAGDLAVVYVDSGNAATTSPTSPGITPPSGWTLQHQDGQGSVWTQTFTSVPASLGKWTTGTGSSGWTYAAISVGGTSGTTRVDASGGGGAQTSRSVNTGSATSTGP
jgi:hypothetical protein